MKVFCSTNGLKCFMVVNKHICHAKALYIIFLMSLCVGGELLVTIAPYDIGCPLQDEWTWTRQREKWVQENWKYPHCDAGWFNWARHVKTCLMPFVNNKGADQPAHPRSLISTCLFAAKTNAETRISMLQLFSVAEEAGLNLIWSEIPKTHFCKALLNCELIILRIVGAQSRRTITWYTCGNLTRFALGWRYVWQ